MIYLANIASNESAKISAKCNRDIDADLLIDLFRDQGVELFRVCAFTYWLQSHGFWRLAAITSPLCNP